MSGGDPDCSPALKWAAEVIPNSPALSPYVCLILNISYVVLAGLKRKIAVPFIRGTVIVKLNTKPCQAKNAFPSTHTAPDELIVVIRTWHGLLSQ